MAVFGERVISETAVYFARTQNVLYLMFPHAIYILLKRTKTETLKALVGW